MSINKTLHYKDSYVDFNLTDDEVKMLEEIARLELQHEKDNDKETEKQLDQAWETYLKNRKNEYDIQFEKRPYADYVFFFFEVDGIEIELSHRNNEWRVELT